MPGSLPIRDDKILVSLDSNPRMYLRDFLKIHMSIILPIIKKHSATIKSSSAN